MRLRADLRAWHEQWDALMRHRGAIGSRQVEVDCAIKRLHVEPLVGEFVSITDVGKEATKVQPQAGDVGRLVKVDGHYALIDFGDELRTWLIPLWAVGGRQDPLADVRGE